MKGLRLLLLAVLGAATLVLLVWVVMPVLGIPLVLAMMALSESWRGYVGSCVVGALLVALLYLLYTGAGLIVKGCQSCCSQCGRELSLFQRDFTGCPRCRAAEARPATVGWGTLLLIWILLGFGSEGRELWSSVENLNKTSETQAKEIRELRIAVKELRKGELIPK